jgi:hypothetical protein
MDLIEAFTLLAIIALILFICACRRTNRREAVRAERMRRYLEIAIRAEAALLDK